jgi:hypothetical protein
MEMRDGAWNVRTIEVIGSEDEYRANETKYRRRAAQSLLDHLIEHDWIKFDISHGSDGTGFAVRATVTLWKGPIDAASRRVG